METGTEEVSDGRGMVCRHPSCAGPSSYVPVAERDT